jgi:hypothetical protein
MSADCDGVSDSCSGDGGGGDEGDCAMALLATSAIKNRAPVPGMLPVQLLLRDMNCDLPAYLFLIGYVMDSSGD